MTKAATHCPIRYVLQLETTAAKRVVGYFVRQTLNSHPTQIKRYFALHWQIITKKTELERCGGCSEASG